MAYCTESDLAQVRTTDELRRLTDLNGDGVADTGVVSAAIAWADSRIDSYVGKRYTVPLASTPDTIRDCSVVIAIYRLYANRQSVDDTIRKDYDDAITWLKDIAAGKATLGLEEPPAESPGAGSVEYTVDDRHFGRDVPL